MSWNGSICIHFSDDISALPVVEVERLEAELFEEREKIIRMEEETSAMKAAFSGERGPTVSLQGEDTLSKLQLELRTKNELVRLYFSVGVE